MKYVLFISCALCLCSAAPAQPFSIEFDAGVTGWRTVLDGVMGGRSTGRITQPEDGILRFSGELSLENNGGFSQTQTTVPEASFQYATGIETRVRGDGRTYQFDVRCSDVRMMAGSFQTKFETVAGEWVTLRLPFEDFRLYSFGSLVANAPKLTPARVESVGVTLADKKPGAFQLDIDFVRAMSPEGRSLGAGSNLEAVAERADLTTLLALVKASGLQLPADGRVTIFAPTNEAFAAIPSETVKFLTSDEGQPTLLAILKHHILPTALDSGSLLQRRAVVALSGQSLAINGDLLTIAGASLLRTDIPFDRGLVYVVDRVLMPETRSVAEIVSQDARLATLFTAVTAAGLAAQLGSENEGPWTLLAPSNEAFAALGAETIKALLANPSKLTGVLSAHVIPSRIRRKDMIAQRSARTLLGRDAVSFSLAGGQISASGAGIIAGDIEASNGVIHIIDRVILPDSSAGGSSPAERPKAPAAAVSGLLELAIERGVPLFNSGRQDACATIYEVTIAAIIDLASDAVGKDAAERLRLALAEGQAENDATTRAWIFRRAMDRLYEDARR
jgi:uncharacterized surface protein with fasciclin (FAS1) repeats